MKGASHIKSEQSCYTPNVIVGIAGTVAVIGVAIAVFGAIALWASSGPHLGPIGTIGLWPSVTIIGSGSLVALVCLAIGGALLFKSGAEGEGVDLPETLKKEYVRLVNKKGSAHPVTTTYLRLARECKEKSFTEDQQKVVTYIYSKVFTAKIHVGYHVFEKRDYSGNKDEMVRKEIRKEEGTAVAEILSTIPGLKVEYIEAANQHMWKFTGLKDKPSASEKKIVSTRPKRKKV